jgi:glycerol-3-phosphate dehydrogenase
MILPTRAETLKTLTAETWDVLTLGGGVVGAAVVRDAAMRGLRAALIEQYDFAYGASSRTTRLLHGGLRYLAQGRLGLVWDAGVEKKILRDIAPHLAEPTAFTFPVFRGGTWPLWQMRLGVRLYDLLCGGKNFNPSRALSSQEATEALPGLRRADLSGAVRYFDAVTRDARLTLDMLRSAARHQAVVCNYVRCQNAKRENNLWICRARDAESETVLELRARCVVSARGPWTERIRLRLTKGVHLTIRRDRLPLNSALTLDQGGRVLFAVPWGRRLILGTTDDDYHGRIEDVRPNAEDVEKVLGALNDVFPDARLIADDVKSAWAGLRPLLASDATDGPSAVTRAHVLRETEPYWLEAAGGKLTTCRLMAEQLVNRVVRRLGVAAKRCRTAQEPLLAEEMSVACARLVPEPPDDRAVEHYCAAEWARHLDDVMIRRSDWAHYGDDPLTDAEAVSAAMARALGWNEERRCKELEAFRGTAFRL